MNLFEFFHAAAYRYLGRNELTQDEQSELKIRIDQLNQGFGGSEPIDYSDPLTRLAYMFSYAPKHAIIWREYFRMPPQFEATGSFKLNSIGTACGPEIIGCLEGLNWNRPGVATAYCHDREEGWKPILEAVAQEYSSRKGNILKIVSVELDGLHPGKRLLGSMVLSEIVKQNTHDKFHGDMTTLIGPASGYFLDIPKCRLPNRTEPFVSDLFNYAFDNFTQMNFQVKDIINREMDECPNCRCKIPLMDEPKLNMFLPEFK